MCTNGYVSSVARRESGRECAQPRITSFEVCMADSMGNSTINPVIRYTIDPVHVVYVYVCMCICINNKYFLLTHITCHCVWSRVNVVEQVHVATFI